MVSSPEREQAATEASYKIVALIESHMGILEPDKYGDLLVGIHRHVSSVDQETNPKWQMQSSL